MTEPIPLPQIKSALRAAWVAGDFGQIARRMTGPSEEFARRAHAQAAPPAGARALDVATGTGNVALPLARLGLQVTGVDIAPNLLEQARGRAAAEQLLITFDEGDAEALPYPDASFDLVTTMFGAMFAPRPQVVASELARVLRLGGLLAMANWTPGGFSGLMFRVTARHVPPPPDLPPPALWGEPATAHSRLQAAGFTAIAAEPVAVPFDFPEDPAGVVRFFRTWFGPTAAAFARLDEDAQRALTDDLEELWSTHNNAIDPEQHTLVANEYLLVTARRAAAS